MMSRKLFLIIIVIAIISLGVGLYFFFSSSQNQSGGNITSTIKDFFPFGKGGGAGDVSKPTPEPEPGPAPEPEPIPEVVKLHQLSTNPVSGYAIFDKERYVETTPIATDDQSTLTENIPKTEKVLAVRYGEKATANIFDIFADTLKDARVTNTTIPKVYESFWGNSATQTLLRYLDDNNKTIQTYFASIPVQTLGEDMEAKELTGTFLPTNILDVSISPDTKKMFYLTYFTGTVIGSTANIDGTKKIDVFSSSFYEWLSQWIDNKKIALTTKASGYSPGYLYILDTTTKINTRVLGDIYGLTTLMSPDGKKVLYSQTTGNTIETYIYDISTRVTTNIGLKTLPEKCVWTTDSTTLFCAVPDALYPSIYPDGWYQGVTSFDDSFWKITVGDSITTNVLFNPSSITGTTVDGTKLQIDPTLSYLFFIDKKSSILWEYDLRVIPTVEEPTVSPNN